MKTLEIQVPEGYEIDQEKSTFEKIIFKEIAKKQLPKVWAGLDQISGFFVNATSQIRSLDFEITSTANENTFTTEELATSSIALAKYSQLKQHYANDIEAFVPIHKDYEEALKPIFELFYGKEWRAAYYLGLLIQLKNHINSRHPGDKRYSIFCVNGDIQLGYDANKEDWILSFDSDSTRYKFKETFYDLITFALPLL